nr:MAG TPA: hypothetical protein [Caudoviricetes sp.]
MQYPKAKLKDKISLLLIFLNFTTCKKEKQEL